VIVPIAKNNVVQLINEPCPPIETWTLSIPQIPPRSQLFPLEPIGLGSALTESLISYVMRLADAHTVRVGDLICRTLLDIPNPQGKIIASKITGVTGSDIDNSCGYAINGVTDRAERWVHALEIATCRRDLKGLTLLQFRFVLPRHMFSQNRRWCSLCLEQWRTGGQIIYEPLIWAIEVASYCQEHRRPLVSVCHHCSRSLRPIGFYSRPGFCERCDGWLGTSSSSLDDLASNETYLEQQMWSCKQVASLIEMLPFLDPVEARRSFQRNLRVYLEKLGDQRIMAEFLRCSPARLGDYLNGSRVPRIESLLSMSRILNVTTSSFFNPSGPAQSDLQNAKDAVAGFSGGQLVLRRQPTEIRQSLQEALGNEVPVSLTAIARQLGYKSTHQLYHADLELSHKIAKRFLRSNSWSRGKKRGTRKICEKARLEEVLKQALNSKEPPTIREIRRSLGYASDSSLHKHFPGLCTAIRKKCDTVKRAHLENVRLTLKNALQENPPPSLSKLAKRIGCSSSKILERQYPNLCGWIKERYQAQFAKHGTDIARKALEMLVENPVPSAAEVCRRLNITKWYMRKHFPSIQTMIADQHRRCISLESKQKFDLSFRRVFDIAAELHGQGTYPSDERILRLLPKPHQIAWQDFHAAARRARGLLNISA
jgi:AraC-like DNA-binding protein